MLDMNRVLDIPAINEHRWETCQIVDIGTIEADIIKEDTKVKVVINETEVEGMYNISFNTSEHISDSFENVSDISNIINNYLINYSI